MKQIENQQIEEKIEPLLNDEQLKNMTWKEVVEVNTKHFIKHSIYDFEAPEGKYPITIYADNGIGGAIKRSELDRLIDEKTWKKAQKK